MKHCIITNEAYADFEIRDMEAVGFYQWRNIFQGEILEAQQILPVLKDGDFDIIQVRVTPKNLPVILAIRRSLGENSATKLVVSLDEPLSFWGKKLGHLKDLKAAIQKADVVFGAEYTICRALEKLTGRTVYELPHPADIEKIRAYAGMKQEMILNILYQPKMRDLRKAIELANGYQVKLRVVFYQQANPKYLRKLARRKIEALICQNETEFCKALAEGKAVVVPSSRGNYGKWIIYAAAMSSIVIGNTFSDASRRCYFITSADYHRLRRYLDKFLWVMWDQPITEFLRENAFHKVQYYNWSNLQNRLLRLITRETQDQRFEAYFNSLKTTTVAPVFLRDIQYLSGETCFKPQPDELTVVCLVKNGMEYLPEFLDYYQHLGVTRFLFIDNGSTDGTVEFLQNRPRVTVYQTALPHKHYESEIRRTVIESCLSGGWVLCVDIDEFFDYPYSGQISIAQFLKYLHQHKYTAVIAYLLDMFPKTPEDEAAGVSPSHGHGFGADYCYYDLSHLKKDKYFNHNPNFCNYNRLSDKSMPCYYGGIRGRYFGEETSKYILIKHPLMFIDGKIEPVTDPHFCNKAHIADVSCLLKHYKFTGSFKKRIDELIQAYGYFGQIEHEAYSKILKEQNEIDFYSPTAKKLEHTNDLVQSGFLKVSKRYQDFITGVS